MTGQLVSHDLSDHTLVTPPIGKDGKRIRYSILEVRRLCHPTFSFNEPTVLLESSFLYPEIHERFPVV